jgi:cellulose biosynthesis protein BcsQ
MTNQDQLREAVEVIKDHLNRNQFWNRDKNRNDMLEVLLDLAQSHLDGKWISKDEFEKKMERTHEIIRKWEGGQSLVKINYESLASAIRTYLKVGR